MRLLSKRFTDFASTHSVIESKWIAETFYVTAALYENHYKARGIGTTGKLSEKYWN